MQEAREKAEQERADADPGAASAGRNLYDETLRDPRLGRPPGIAELKLLPTVEDEPASID